MPQTLRVMAYNILYGGTPGGNGGARRPRPDGAADGAGQRRPPRRPRALRVLGLP